MYNTLNEKIITIMNFHANVLPGTATIYKGTVIKGKNIFAGMVGFLPYGISSEQYLEKLNYNQCIPLISNAAASIIAVINPDEMVFTGNLLDSDLEDLEKCYTIGMYHTAINKRYKKTGGF